MAGKANAYVCNCLPTTDLLLVHFGLHPNRVPQMGHGQKGVVITKIPTDTERTLVIHVVPSIHIGLPLMLQSTGTLVTCPPDTLMIAGIKLYGPQV